MSDLVQFLKKRRSAEQQQNSELPTATRTINAAAPANDSNNANHHNKRHNRKIVKQQQQQQQQQKQQPQRTFCLHSHQLLSAAAAAGGVGGGGVGVVGRSSATIAAGGPATTSFIVGVCRNVNCQFNNNARTPSSRAAIAEPEESYCNEGASQAEQPRQRKKRSSSCTSNVTSNSSTSTANCKFVTPRDHSNDSGVSDSDEDQADDSAQHALNRKLIWRYEPPAAADQQPQPFTCQIHLDVLSWLLFALAFLTRFYKLTSPRHIVFDELHYGKYVSQYIRQMFFFDQHPPLGKQLVAATAYLSGGYDGNFTFSRIGDPYPPQMPLFWLRFVPALCGSCLPTALYKLLLTAGLNRWTALLGGLLVIFDNALLTQSRFILMEPMLLLFGTIAIYCLLRFQRAQFVHPLWWVFGLAAASFLTFTFSIKYVGSFTSLLAAYMILRYFWDLLFDATLTDFQIIVRAMVNIFIFTLVPIAIYLSIFYVHLSVLSRAGSHDYVMTSAFQASLDGGLASITHGQPLRVVHGSQITLRHTHGRTCWLHSHAHVYPVRYPDKRGSSHQQQVTCYSFKDVNNWWIVKRPDRDDLIVESDMTPIRDGDVIQLVHGITSRALNSHDVAAPMTPQCQEVSCYIDYEIKMAGELLWRVEILNKDTEGPIWHAIKSEIRLIHETTGTALRFSGRQLPDWGFNQHEIVADKNVEHKDAIWNVEEHRYTQKKDQRERERELLNAEMIPMKETKLTFWQKFLELQTKMLWNTKLLQTHMYSSEPYEWPLLDKGIAYWMDTKSNGQIHLLGNVALWYSGTLGLLVYMALGIFYLLRRRRECYDIPEMEWLRFLHMRDVFFFGFLAHYLPYFFMDRTLFLHNYLPAFLYKISLLCYVIEHVDYLIKYYTGRRSRGSRSGGRRHTENATFIDRLLTSSWCLRTYRLSVIAWLICVLSVFVKFLPLSYGIWPMTAEEVLALRWKDTWDFILQRNYALF